VQLRLLAVAQVVEVMWREVLAALVVVVAVVVALGARAPRIKVLLVEPLAVLVALVVVALQK